MSPRDTRIPTPPDGGSGNVRHSADERRHVFEAETVGIAFFKLSGVITDANTAFLRMVGFSQSDVRGGKVRWDELTVPEWKERTRQAMEELQSGGRISPYEKECFRSDGSRWWALVTGQRLGPDYGVTYVIDVTERRRMEDDLRESRHRLQLLVENVRDYAIFTLNADGRISSWNEGAVRITGYGAADVIGEHVAVMYTPEDRAAGVAHDDLAEAVKGGSHLVEAGLRQRKDGSRYWARLVTTALLDEQRKLKGFLRINQDITELRRVTQDLRENEARLQAVIDTAVDAIITIDERGIVESMNAAGERMFGYKAEEVVGRNVNLLMPEPYHSEHDRYIQDYLQTGVKKIIGIGRDVLAQRKDGSVFPINLAVSEVWVGSRRIFTGIIHDLTHRRRMERELVEIGAAERRRIGQDLHDGLCQQLTGAGFSLELMRSHLTRIASSVEEKGVDAKAVAPALLQVAEQLDHLNDLLGKANAEARATARGLNPVTLETKGLGPALEELGLNLARAFGATVIVDCERFRQFTAPAVAHHLYRIAQEAANNALRHGQAGNVWITCSEESPILRIEDDGSGFDPSAARRIDPVGGGMGLHIIDYRAKMIGHRLEFRRREPTGMIVEVIQDPAEAAAQASVAAPRGEGRSSSPE